jgi:hypothetical protein
MKIKLCFLFVFAVSVCVEAAHLEYWQGSMGATAGGRALNATESDPPAPQYYNQQTGYSPAMLDVAVNCSVSTAQADSRVVFFNDVTPQGVQIGIDLTASGRSDDSASTFQCYMQIDPDAYYTSNVYALFYNVVSDGEPAGTTVLVNLSWLTQGQFAGQGWVHFNNNSGLKIAVNQDPSQQYPASENVVYSGGSAYLSETWSSFRSEATVFPVKVGDTLAVYLDAYGNLTSDLQQASGQMAATFELELTVAEGRLNTADITGDKKVNLEDLAMLAANWLWEAPPAPNQSCQTAMTIRPNYVFEDSTVDTDSGELWYKIRPAAPMRGTVSLCGSDFDTRLTWFDGSGGQCPSWELGSNDDFCGQQSELIADMWDYQDYYFRVDSPTGQRGNVRLELTPIPRPDNDENWTATEVTAGTVYTGDNTGSVGDSSVWFTYTPDVSDYYRLSLCGSSFDTQLYVRDQDWNVIEYSDNVCDYTASELSVYLEAGSTYWIEVGSYTSEVRGTYQFQLTQGASAPANDQWQQATLYHPYNSVEGSTTLATGSDLSSCGDGDDQDVWYIMTASHGQIWLFGLSTLDAGKTMTIYDGSTGSPGTELACGQSTGGTLYLSQYLNISQTIYIRIGGSQGQPGYFSLYVN